MSVLYASRWASRLLISNMGNVYGGCMRNIDADTSSRGPLVNLRKP
jgi:hypothetical protein